ncbi:MAG TPA: arginine--tRNA ligase, partial [Candidatus Pacearchaeota archaeon]|nr:arginine--tRNA ligase [Candidatus Pacearchaeota archaeon]
MKEAIAGILKKALKELKVDLKKEEIERFLETPPSSDMGDYAFPCFFLASKLKQEPSQIALEIRGKIGTAPEDFESIQTSGPYINFFLDRKKMAVDLVRSILAKKDNFGKIDIGKKQKALVEHTSINPNASPHVGRVRNAIIGDSIVRILEFVNFKPEVHYYVNDVSKQIAMLVLAKAEKLKFENMLKKYIQISKKVKKSEKLEKQVF